MDYLKKLQEMAAEVESEKAYKGYWYKISDIVTILAIGLLSGLQNAHEIWQWANSRRVAELFHTYFEIKRMPCYAQFMNILGNINVESLNHSFMKWCKLLLEDNIAGKTVAIDGKTICSTVNMQAYTSPLHIVSAYISEMGITIGQLATEDKSNEIPTVQALIKLLDIKGAIVVADALNCQRATATAIVDGGGDYLLAVKENQPDLFYDVKLFFEGENMSLEKYEKTESGHGRLETRTAWITHDVSWYENKARWAGLSCFGAVRRICYEKEKRSDETRYFISNKPLSPEALLAHSRNEWGVESMHWLLDVHFNEDRTLLMSANAQRALNILRKTAINLVKSYKSITASKKSLIGIMRDNLFDVDNIPSFFRAFLTPN